MISVINEGDLISAYAEWNIVNEKGQFDNNGLFVYVANIWISPKSRRSEKLKELITEINNHPFTKNTVWVYWNREKKNKLYCFYKIQILKLFKIGEKYEQQRKISTASTATCSVA